MASFQSKPFLLSPKVAAFFWARVNKNGPIPPHQSGLGACWMWTGSLDKRYGYGRIDNIRAHRISWMLAHGLTPSSINVLHKCDVKLCVNPEHLFIGTHADNVADMISKRRQAKGERISQARLTLGQVQQIRASGEIYRVLAERFGVTPSTIGRAKRNEQWRNTE